MCRPLLRGLSPCPAEAGLAAPSLCPSATSCSQLAPREAGPGARPGQAALPAASLLAPRSGATSGDPPKPLGHEGVRVTPSPPRSPPAAGFIREGWARMPPCLLKMT